MIGAKTLCSSRSTKLKTLLSFFTHRSLTKNQSLSSSSRAICTRYHFQIPAKNPSLFFFICYFSAKPNLPPAKKQPLLVSSSCFTLTRDGNYTDGTLATAVCPGCGVHMQDSNPKLPGFFTKPSVKDPNYKASSHLVPVSFESEFSDSVKKGLTVEAENPNSDSGSTHRPEKPVVCARCHSLRHYGRVKDPNLENLLPEFDFYHTVGMRLVSTGGARSVVLLVVDAVDFDGSFPEGVVKLVTEAIEENYKAWKQGKSGNVPRIVLVVTKIDLLPTSLSPTRFEHWIRQRARKGGATSIKKVHFVSAVRDWGLKDLVEDVVELAGPRGNVWAVGTQNAGKSTLINALGKCVSGSEGKISHLTEAPVPGTTLGIVRVEGVLPGNAKLFDTPGLLNPHQITTRLTRDEQKLVHISKEVKPRTYRIKAGHSVHIGGLMRLDVEELSVDSVYITVWASALVPLHMGKTERASTMPEEHFGRQLQPPVGEKRVQELGKWVRQEFRVSGNTWDSSSRDLAAGGLGWFAVGLKGEAVLGVWTYEGVDVVCRNSLIPYRSHNFEVAGFTVSKIVSQADQVLNKSQGQSEKEKKSSRKREAAPA
ncbi:hypothetical protein K2173_010922 [Erythroxylum novogranatense]|uniref:G domain-containing protein n=1 Tax=Erythroxylum novogranatense TaxID=1862640 RepID=A0AAV8T0Z0_9ROSI|nr:hypothetical protein K2173_010922 [Erythroxylum novogranatense]